MHRKSVGCTGPGRIRSSRYRMTSAEAEAATIAAAAAAAEEEAADSTGDGQLRTQAIGAAVVLVLFVTTFAAVVTLLLLPPSARSAAAGSADFLRLEPRSLEASATTMEEAARRLSEKLTRAASAVHWRPLLAWGGFRPLDCARLGRYPQSNEVCVPSTIPLGPCNSYGGFGYFNRQPCLMLSPGSSMVGNYSSDPRIRCRATDSASGDNLPVAYYPTVRHLSEQFAYFPRYFFPYRRDMPFYLPPVAMVQVLQLPPSGHRVRLSCSLANAEFSNFTTERTMLMMFD